jgi:GTP cyclohydrolase I
MPTDSARDGAAAARPLAEALRALGVEPAGPHLAETPARVAELWGELFAAHGTPVALPDDSMFANPDPGAGLVLAADLPFYAMCAHHLLPFFGRAHVAFLPGARMVGFGALARLVDVASRRPTLQEDLGASVADALERGLAPRGVAVLVTARHLCMEMRGMRRRARMETLEWRGAFQEDEARRIEFLARVARPVRGPRVSPGGGGHP